MRRYIVNLPNYEKPIVEELFKQPGMESYGIDDGPHTDWPDLLREMQGSHFSVYQDTTIPDSNPRSFMELYVDFCDKPEWQMYLTLCEQE